MKLIATFIFVVFFLGDGISQEIDKRLLGKYSEVELADLQLNSPDRLALLTYALDNACYFSDLPEGKSVVLETISLTEIDVINYINLGLDIEAQNQYYRVEGQDKMLVVKSEWVLNHEMNK